MANFVKCIIFSCLFVVAFAIKESDFNLADTKTCNEYCLQSYIELPDQASSCARGCRFYAISYLMEPSKGDAEDECLRSCDEAYTLLTENAYLQGCQEGCSQEYQSLVVPQLKDDLAVNHGAPVALDTKGDVEFVADSWMERDQTIAEAFGLGEREEREDKEDEKKREEDENDWDVEEEKKKELEVDEREVEEERRKMKEEKEKKMKEEEEEMSGMSLSFDRPVMQVRKVVAQVRGAFHILKTSVLTYFLQDDDTLLAVQSQPEVIVGLAPEDGFNTPEEALQEAEGHPQSRGESIQSDGFGTIRVSGFSGLDGPLPSSSPGVEVVPLSARRSAYLLHLLLLLAVVSLGLLGLSYCLAAARHQQRRTLKAANLQTAVQQQPLKLVRPEDLTKLSLMEEEDQQAPPLPNKHDLALAHANV